MSAEVVLGTAGHVDHGKTALVRALTGRDTDRLAAEKARGISIELGFAPLRLASGRLVSLIDVPGHERFVRHMVAGATGVDGFILCVAADDGVMPQTREHLAVLELLGIRRGVVALTRSDMADPARAAAEVAPLVAPGTPILPVCAPRGDGMDRVRAAIEALVAAAPPRPREGPTRLWIDRSFTIRGTGTVVTGTLWGGDVGRGDHVAVLPSAATGRVRAVQVHDADRDRASGGRVALALAGISTGDSGRGSCLVRAGDPWRPTSRLGVELSAVPGDGRLDSGADVTCFLGTHEGPAVCVLLDRPRLEAGRRCLAELRLDAPVCARPGDRLVLRSGGRGTIAGAEVIDPHPPPRRTRRERLERLGILARGDATAILELRAREARREGVAAPPGAAGEGIVIVGGRAFERKVVAAARSAALAAAETGASVATLRAATRLPAGPAATLVDGLLEEGALPLRDREPPAAGAGSAPAARIAALLEDAGLRGSSSARLATLSGLGSKDVRAALDHLRGARMAVRAEGIWFSRAALDRAWEVARPLLEGRPLGIAELRDAWGVGRRHALAIAAHLDSRRLTRREGDMRVLRRAGGAG